VNKIIDEKPLKDLKHDKINDIPTRTGVEGFRKMPES
jgi:hypothetical protein